MINAETMSPPADWQQQFSDFVNALQQRRSIPGIAVTVFDSSSTLFAAGFGQRNLEADLPVTPDTIFGIASVTKSLTCLAVLQLASRGKLGLDDPITRYLPQFDLWDAAAPATIRHFMNQTSGLPALPTLVHAMAANRPEPDADLPDLGSYAGLAAYVNEQSTLLAAPGELFCYQNDAFGLLGAVIEQASGIEYTQYMTENVFAPLGMMRTTFNLDAVLADDNATTLYAPADDGGLEVADWDEAPAMAACGFLRSTSRDLQKYVQFLLTAGAGNLLGVDAALLTEMRSPQVPYGPGSWYGFGLRVQPDHHGVTLIGHSGGLTGVSSHIGFIPELGVGAAVLTNLEDIPASMIWLAAMNALMGLPVGTPQYDPVEHQPTPAELRAVLGSYRSGEPWGRTELFLAESGALHAFVSDPPEEYPVFFASPDELVIRGKDQLNGVMILRHADGSIRGLHQGSRVLLRVQPR
jgi:CubicO group peptidase (beta-lactamase class C family)